MKTIRVGDIFGNHSVTVWRSGNRILRIHHTRSHYAAKKLHDELYEKYDKTYRVELTCAHVRRLHSQSQM